MNEAQRKRKAMTDPYLPHVKRICGQYIIGEAGFEDDALCATDLRVLTIGDVRIGVRLRQISLLAKHPEYADEFTIRGPIPSGLASELDKIRAGWGDYIFYGWMDTVQPRVLHWTLGRLDVFRQWVQEYASAHAGQVPGRLQSNGPGDSRFYAFSLCSAPPGWPCAPPQFEVAHEPLPDLDRLRQRKVPKAPNRYHTLPTGQSAFFLG